MSNSKSFAQRAQRATATCRTGYLRQFGRNEDGSVIVLTLLLLIIMLVLGGMAVDFMRFESRRSLLQSVSDRAVLAAAELDQTLDAKEVVIDYFEKAGFGDTIVGEPRVSGDSNNRSVEVDARLDLNTFYLRFVGIDELSAPASSAAVEGTGNVEISLVLDISGSMGWSSGDGAGNNRMHYLKIAANSFVSTLLKPEYEDQISISLVTYSEHVNLGDSLFSKLAIPTTITDTSEWEAQWVIDNPGVPVPDPAPDGVATSFTNPVRCVGFTDAAFTKTTYGGVSELEQVPFFDPNGDQYSDDATTSPAADCQNQYYEGIIALSQDADLLSDAIDRLTPRHTTSIHLGMKWGVTLIDPSFRDILSTVSSVDPEFAGVRPADYASATSTLDTVKYIVLMTDGENWASNEVNPTAYDTVLKRRHWSNYSYNRWRRHYNNGDSRAAPFDASYTDGPLNQIRRGLSVTHKDVLMQNICSAARDRNITIFTIAMNAPTAGETQMRLCASSAAHYYETEGAAIVSVFESIAKQITSLRLSL